MQLVPSDKTLEHNRDFRIKHYAGDVTYAVPGFIDKNRDSLYQDFKRLLYNRSVTLSWLLSQPINHEIATQILQQLFPNFANPFDNFTGVFVMV